jgi:adenosylcobinamide-GDP ribazoletransferase
VSGLILALGTLSIFRVRVGRTDRDAVTHAMLWAPVVGLLLGTCAAVTSGLALVPGTSSLLAAVIGIATLAVLTRGLHLDGLADTADGFGSGRPAADALRVMKASDVGPFGVAALVLTLMLQVTALQGAWAAGYGMWALPIAARTGRAALLLGCRRGIPAARPEGLGAWAAGTVPTRTALAVCALVAAGAGAATALGAGLDARPFASVLAVVAGLVAAALLLRRAVRRFGGVTGDVLGALVETATTVALMVLALS